MPKNDPVTRLNTLLDRLYELKAFDDSYQSQIKEKVKLLSEFQQAHNHGCLLRYKEYVKTFQGEADYFQSKMQDVAIELRPTLQTYCDEFKNLQTYLSCLSDHQKASKTPSEEKLTGLKELKSKLENLTQTFQGNTYLLQETNVLLNNVDEFLNSEHTTIFFTERKDIEKMQAILKQDLAGYKNFKEAMDIESRSLDAEINELIAEPAGSKKNSQILPTLSSPIFSTTQPSTVQHWRKKYASDILIQMCLDTLERDLAPYIKASLNK